LAAAAIIQNGQQPSIDEASSYSIESILLENDQNVS